MKTGNGKLHAKVRTLFQAEFSADWTATLVKGKEALRILGPGRAGDRRLRCVVEPGHQVVIETEGLWSHTAQELSRRETNSGVPVELGIPEERPLSLREEMMRFIRTEMSNYAERSSGAETFEEADDFDIPDEDQWHSPYELVDMQEEWLDEGDLPPADQAASETAPEAQSAAQPATEEPAAASADAKAR